MPALMIGPLQLLHQSLPIITVFGGKSLRVPGLVDVHVTGGEWVGALAIIDSLKGLLHWQVGQVQQDRREGLERVAFHVHFYTGVARSKRRSKDEVENALYYLGTSLLRTFSRGRLLPLLNDGYGRQRDLLDVPINVDIAHAQGVQLVRCHGPPTTPMSQRDYD